MAENSAASLSGKKRAVRLGRLTSKGASRRRFFKHTSCQKVTEMI